MLKNTSGQTFTVVAFNASGKVTGNASAITCTLAIDGGTRVALGDTNPVEIAATGVYEFDLTQAETNGHELSFVPASSTSGVEVLGSPSNVIYTTIPTLQGAIDEATGTLEELVIGDDYTTGNGEALSWDFTPPTGTTVGGGSCKFGGGHPDGSGWLVTGSLSDIGAGEFRATFDLPRASTEGLLPKRYSYSVEIVNDAGLERIVKKGTVQLVEKQT